jgi:asparagine synthase (glutamine-hydrolysing)
MLVTNYFMSGIYGIINLKKNPVEKHQMDKMEALLIHRGIDGKAQWINKNVGLGHLKLEITPESEYERLPLEYKQWVITADARIDNRDELDTSLSIEEAEREKTPDTTYIVKAYEKWGKDCVKHLIGDFAFAIWDKNEETLFCARDHIGIKPFFYLKTEDKFIFSSELKTLVELKEIKLEIKESKLGDFILLIQDIINPKETLFKGIHRVLPAYFGFLKQGVFRLESYWLLKESKHFILNHEEACIEKFRQLLIQAVGCRMRTKYDIGATLSGGLDSSSIVCMAARQLAQKDRNLYTASPVLPENWEGIEEDEKEYIVEVLKQEKNIIAQYITTEQFQIFEDLEDILNKTYFPVNTFYNMDNALTKALKEKSAIRIILSGFTGDMGVSQKANGLISFLISNLRWRVALNIIVLRAKVEKTSSLIIFLREGIAPFTPQYLKNLYKKLRGQNKKTNLLETAITHSFDKRLGLSEKIEKYEKRLPHNKEISSYINFAFKGSITNFEELNIQKAHFGLEENFPFADIRILNFLVSIPPQYFQVNGWKRGLIRHAMISILPTKIIWRLDKTSYVPNYNTTFLKNKNLIYTIFETTQSNNIFNNTIIEKNIESAKVSRKWSDPDYTNDLIILGYLAIISKYFNKFTS